MTFEEDREQWYNLKGNEVMGYSYGALGDAFAMFSHTVNMGKQFNKPMLLSCKGNGKKQNNFRKFFDIVKNKHFVEFTDNQPTEFNKLFCTRKHKEPYCELEKSWNVKSKYDICFHYDTMTKDKRSTRFPDVTEEQYFLNRMKELGAINISYPMPLTEVVDIASKCSCFIGIESGISHIIHAVGTPCIIRNWSDQNDNKKVENYHPNKKYTLIKDFYEL